GRASRPRYRTTQLQGYDLTDDQYTYLNGLRAYRNAWELAEEYRSTAIARANE
ncbi:hypothetical protein CC78DRAFT_419331, partial [Lojkania enalia]